MKRKIRLHQLDAHQLVLPNLKIPNRVLEILLNPMHTKDICYPANFGIPDSTEVLEFQPRSFLTKSGSHTEPRLKPNYTRGLRMSPKASGSTPKILLNQIIPKLTELSDCILRPSF